MPITNNQIIDPSNIKLDPLASKLVGRTILVSGCGRTGTSMMGNLIHSLENIEYIYEPPLIIALLNLIHSMPEPSWRLLYENYLFEDFLLNALAGRSLNTNSHDDSSILKVKSLTDIQDRQSHSHRRNDDLLVAESTRIAVKIPGILPSLDQLLKYYPRMHFILMSRKPESIVSSLLIKGWYSDTGLSGHVAFIPYRQHGKYNLPMWLNENDTDQFLAMSEIERCCFYYINAYDRVWPKKQTIHIDYDQFVKNPTIIFMGLAKKLNEPFGQRTQELLDKVKEPSTDRTIDVKSISPDLLERMYNTATNLAQISLVNIDGY